MAMNSELMDCIKRNDLDGVKSFVERGGSINYKNEEALIAASISGRLQIVEYLVKQGANIHVDNEHALTSAISFGKKTVVEYLIKSGADIYFDGGVEVFNLAVIYGHLDIVKYLIEECKIAFDHIQTIKDCMTYNLPDILKYLVHRGLDILDEKYDAIKIVCIYGHIDLFKFIIDQDSNRFEDQTFESYIRKLTNLLEDNTRIYYRGYFRYIIEYFKFCKKIYDKRCQRSSKVIYFWWIPICYDVTRPCGKRMALKNFENYKKLYEEFYEELYDV